MSSIGQGTWMSAGRVWDFVKGTHRLVFCDCWALGHVRPLCYLPCSHVHGVEGAKTITELFAIITVEGGVGFLNSCHVI